jgi:glycosyltransferase involved in cell wall biosynthesis
MSTHSKKIIYISYDGMTDPLGQSQVIPYLARLTKYGYQFIILSCDKPERYAASKDYVQKLIDPFPIKWVSIPYHKKPPVISTAYDIVQLKKKAKDIYRQEKFDMIHARAGISGLVALQLKNVLPVKLLNDIRGFWADERVDGGLWNTHNILYNLIYKFFKKKEKELLENADYNICLTDAANKEIHKWKNISTQPVLLEVIPCSVDLELFNPDTIDANLKKEFKKELHISDTDFIISYLGSVGSWYLTKEMMDFCKVVSDKIPAAKILFISPDDTELIKDAALSSGLSVNKIVIRQAKRHEVPILLSFSNYSLFFIKPCYSKIASSPTKHGEIMAMGIPVITNTGVGDVEMIVAKYNSGYVLNNFSEKAFAEVVDKMISGNTFDKEEIRKGAHDFYSLEKGVASYKKVYDVLLS